MNPRTPPPLPGPPLIEHLLFENAWAVGSLLAAFALIAWAWRKGRPWASLGLGAACAGLFVVEAAVTTTRERLDRQARALVDRVAAADEEGVAGLLAADARFSRGGSEIDRGAILRAIREDMRGRYLVREHSIRELASSVDGRNVARTRLGVRVTPDVLRVPVGTWWTLDWRLEPGGEWRVRGITLEGVEGAGALDGGL